MVKDLAKLFRCLQIQHVKRDYNGQADALASLAISLAHLRDNYLIIHIGERRVISPLSITIEEDVLLACNTELQECEVQGIDDKSNSGEEDWHEPLIQHLMDRMEPTDLIKHAKMRWHDP